MAVDPVSPHRPRTAFPDPVARPLLHAFLRPPRRPPLGNPRTWLGCDYDSLNLFTSAGIRLSGWSVPHPRPRLAVVLAHGYSSCRETMLPYLRFLRPWGSSAFLFDFRRHGLSGGSTTTLGHRETDDLSAVIQHARTKHPDLPLLLVGESMGAAVSLLVAANDSGVAAVLADCPYATLDEPVANRLRLTFGPEFGERLVPAAHREGERLLGAAPHTIGPADSIHRIAPRPVLLVHGEADRLIPVSHAHRLRELGGPHLQLWTVPDAAHARSVRIAADEYANRVDHWMRSWFGAKPEDTHA